MLYIKSLLLNSNLKFDTWKSYEFLLKCLNFKDLICLYKFYPKYRRIDIVVESTISLCKTHIFHINGQVNIVSKFVIKDAHREVGTKWASRR